jgi:TP901 family phage tail tape measure protein
LELARQGLSVEDSLGRVEVALKLVRVAGIDSQKAVAGLTAAIKGFENAGLTVAQIGDKLADVDTKFAVSTEDLINGLERASASARVAGVSFDELLAAVTTVQERTQRGGAVIGNAFKTIFARLGRTDTLAALESLGISVLDAQGNVRDAVPLFRELAVELDNIGLRSTQAGDIIQKVAGVRQRDILINLIEDLNSEQSKFNQALGVSANSVGALDSKNAQLNQTLDALIKNLATSGQQLASVLGETGFLDAAKSIVGAFSSIVNSITKLLDGDSIGSDFARGFVAALGRVITGPGLGLALAVFTKLFIDLAKFGVQSLKSLLGVNAAAQRQDALQQSILQTILQNENVQRQLLKHEGNRVVQEQILLRIYQQQLDAMAKMQGIAGKVTPGLYQKGFRGGPGGVTRRGAGGYIAEEARDISRGVGGAHAGAKVVSIPNFAFGGGKRGTMVANTSEYYVPNYAGGGDAIFNQAMIKTLGMPSGAQKLRASSGFIPNFARMSSTARQRRGERDTSFVGGSRAGTKNKPIMDPRFVMITPSNTVQPMGMGKSDTGRHYKFGVFGYNDGAKQLLKGKNSTKLRKEVEMFAMQNAMDEALTITGGKPLASKINPQRLNQGAISSVGGSIFEAAISGILTSSQFDGGPTATFDFSGAHATKDIRKLYPGISPATRFIEAKIAGNPKLFNSMANKMERFGAGLKGLNNFAMGQMMGPRGSMRDRTRYNREFTRMRSAGGYVPNYADPLTEAIGRERAAGIPLNQIRVNQSGKLRNSGNPGGLAVTNTRDEPTGRIPNFFVPLVGLGGLSGLTGAAGVGGFLKALGVLALNIESFSYIISGQGPITNQIMKFVDKLGLFGDKVEGIAKGMPDRVKPLGQMNAVEAERRLEELDIEIAQLTNRGKLEQAAFLETARQATVTRLGNLMYEQGQIFDPGEISPAKATQRSRSFFASRTSERRRNNAIEIAGLQGQANFTNTNLQRVETNFEIKKIQNQEQLNTLRDEGLQQITKQVIMSDKIRQVDEDRFMEIVKFNAEQGNTVALAKSLRDEFGIQLEDVEEIVIQAEDLYHTLGLQTLELNQQLTIEQQQAIIEAKRLDNILKINNRIADQNLLLERQQVINARETKAFELGIRNRGPLTTGENRQVSFERNNLRRQQQEAQAFQNYQAAVLNVSLASMQQGPGARENFKRAQQVANGMLQDYFDLLEDNRGEAKADMRDASKKSMDFYLAEQKRDIRQLEENFGPNIAAGFENSMLNALDKVSEKAYDSVGDALLDIAKGFGQSIMSEIKQRAAKQVTNALFDTNFMKGFSNLFSGGKGKGKAAGGYISGGSGVVDDVPAMLMGGEFVMKKSAVQKYGLNFMNSLNQGAVPGYQQGGPVLQGSDNIRTTKFFIDGDKGIYDKTQVFGGSASNERLATARSMDFFVPGERGAGGITGKENLLAFAGQSRTSGSTDVVSMGASGGTLNLEQQSTRLTGFGLRRKSPARQALEEAQAQAFDLALAGKAEEERVIRENQEARTARRKQLQANIASAFTNAAFAAVGQGFQNVSDAGLKFGDPGYGKTFFQGGANGGSFGGGNAMLMGGEFVVGAGAADAIGKDTLESINQQSFANGGPVGSVANSKSSSNVEAVNITINIEKDGSASSNGEGGENPEQARNFSKKIKDVVLNVINEEKRVSGTLFTRNK